MVLFCPHGNQLRLDLPSPLREQKQQDCDVLQAQCTHNEATGSCLKILT